MVSDKEFLEALETIKSYCKSYVCSKCIIEPKDPDKACFFLETEDTPCHWKPEVKES